MGLEKFRKSLEKKGKFNVGFSPIPDWFCTGNAALNEIISGDMRKGVAVSRSTIISGVQGTGKSFLLSNICKNAQKKGYTVVYIDTEFSVGEGFMEKIGVDMSEDKFIPVNLTTIEDTIAFVADLFKNTEPEEKILIALDSLSNLQPEGDVNKFDDAKVAYSQGLPQKMLKQLVNNINGKIGNRNVAFVFTSHMYVAGSDAYGNPVLKPNIGEGTMFLPSIGVQLTKKPLKEGKELSGITVSCKTFKTRYTKLGKTCSFDLPWDTGMDFLDGSLDVLINAGIVDQNGGWLKYVDRETGEEVKFQRSSYKNHADVLMQYYSEYSGEMVEKEEGESNLEMLNNQEQ
jgi:recombination protein RecA